MRKQLFRALRVSEGRFDSDSKTLSQGAALALTAIGELLPRQTTDQEDSETTECAASHLKVLLRQDPGAVGDHLGKLFEGESAELYRKALSHLLEDQDAGIAFKAACHLLALGEPATAVLARAVAAGLSESDSFHQASQLLDQLRSDPFTKPLVMEGIHLGLWGTDRGIALGAARYMLDRGEKADWGVARGLVFGALRHGFFEDWKVIRRLDSLLQEPNARPAVLNALIGAFHTGHSGHRFLIASLILRAGGELNDPIVLEMEETMRRWPLAPLCLLALTDNVAKAHQSAKRLGLEKLGGVLEADSDSGNAP